MVQEAPPPSPPAPKLLATIASVLPKVEFCTLAHSDKFGCRRAPLHHFGNSQRLYIPSACGLLPGMKKQNLSVAQMGRVGCVGIFLTTTGPSLKCCPTLHCAILVKGAKCLFLKEAVFSTLHGMLGMI